MLKTNKKIGLYYLTSQSIAFIILIYGIIIGALPILALACLLTLPTTFYVFNGLYKKDARNYGKYLDTHTWSSFALALILCASYIIMIM